MRAQLVIALGAAALAAAGVIGVASIAGASPNGSGPSSNGSSIPGGATSRMDDGAQLLPKAKITEQQAIDAAQSAASGNLNEVDLEHYSGRLVFNVDVGSKDVKVDATTGDVLATPSDD
jgi:uncharacterized membrane protein YkoI